MRIGYIRVSTIEQNTARQLSGIELDKYSSRTGSYIICIITDSIFCLLLNKLK